VRDYGFYGSRRHDETGAREEVVLRAVGRYWGCNKDRIAKRVTVGQNATAELVARARRILHMQGICARLVWCSPQHQHHNTRAAYHGGRAGSTSSAERARRARARQWVGSGQGACDFRGREDEDASCGVGERIFAGGDTTDPGRTGAVSREVSPARTSSLTASRYQTLKKKGILHQYETENEPIRPILDHELNSAIDSLQSSTAAIEEQCKVLEAQRAALMQLKALDRPNLEVEHLRNERRRKEHQEKTRLDVAVSTNLNTVSLNADPTRSTMWPPLSRNS
jgi:hypothetical protein